ncbi:type II toxin-antitoxin system VapC family toxin [Rhizobium sp. CSW-27]|uniref:type II toxin-antitoxin system VapC family toxin n=1 Tax=Rhizobium sp. CSW-27 TaxID=2839985 RepID=UPI001C0114C5|nr:type II toxin-antitoxin system VapC family toxin [Rhizobium sp. CSW-27]MBT9370631.1 type II toxin-antitoxin system VapC family toxin [Rhizobium sp. CSW-27]
MFLDASAVVAILAREALADDLLRRIREAAGPIHYSSITMYEAVVSLARKTAISIYGDQVPTPAALLAEVQADVEDFMNAIGAIEVPIEAGTHRLALDAARRFGRATGHPARLNFGDCFAYAAAKALDIPLLFVGDDFARTDAIPA